LKNNLVFFLLALAAALLLAAFAPLEKTLGANIRIVYLHGAWVWAAMAGFVIAALAGIAGFVTKQERCHAWSLAWGRTGLAFWLTFLPMSLYVMQANWNGLFLDEPRFRIPLNLVVVGLLMQIGLALIKDRRWASLTNIGYAAALLATMSATQSVLHPDSPIFNSGSRAIQAFFTSMLALLLVAAWQLASAWRAEAKIPEKALS
jgi:hypothetical protein